MKYLYRPLSINTYLSFIFLLFIYACQSGSTGSDNAAAIFEVKLTYNGVDTAKQFGFNVD